MRIDYKKLILKTTLWTLLALFLLTVSIWLMMFFLFPRTLGDFCYSLGIDNMSANLYYKDYEKSCNIDSLYKSLNIEIKCKDHDKVIKYFNEFIEDDEYSEYMNAYRSHNEQLRIGVLEKSLLLNEENYLYNQYVTALINISEENQAFNLALELFKHYDDFTLVNQGVYAFNKFINTQDFNRIPSGYNQSILACMQDYFDDSVELFDNNRDTEDVLQKAYLLALGNRIIEVGQNLNKLYDDDMSTQIQTNNQQMLDINEKIKGLLC